MYYYISGKVVHKNHALAVVETNGIGYEIKVPLHISENLKMDKNIKLYTYLHIQKTFLTLYGFESYEERDVFLLLKNISGIGASISLMILSAMPIKDIQQAITSEDIKSICTIKGIGIKTAQRIILELKNKFPNLQRKKENTSRFDSISVQMRSEALYALITLGMSKKAAEKNISNVIEKKKKVSSVEELVKFALKQI